MSIAELLNKIQLDGKPINGVVQIAADAGQTTIVWDVPKAGAEPARRVLTVESEAITIG